MNRSFLEREFFPFVIKPGRYAGHEPGAVVRSSDTSYRVALLFPRLYDRAILIDRWQRLYFGLNSLSGVSAERAYLPDYDAIALMRDRGIPLFGLETALPVRTADLVLLPMANALDAIAALRMLSLVDLRCSGTDERAERPLVIALPEQDFNCAPVAKSFDGFLYGDSVAACTQLLGACRAMQHLKIPDLIHALTQSLHCFTASFPPERQTDPAASAHSIAEMPSDALITPLIDVSRPRVEIDLTQYQTDASHPGEGMEAILEIIESRLRFSGYDELSLIGVSRQERTLSEFLSKLSRRIDGKRIHLTLDELSGECATRPILESLRRLGAAVPSLAIGGISARLRALAHRPLSHEAILEIARHTFAAGHEICTFEIAVCLPTENDADYDEFATLCRDLQDVALQFGKRTVNIVVRSFVATPHSLFQWDSMPGVAELEQTMAVLKRRVRGTHVRLRVPDIMHSVRDAILLRAVTDIASYYERMSTRTILRDTRESDSLDEGEQDADDESFTDELIAIGSTALAAYSFNAELPWSKITGKVSDAMLAEMRKTSASTFAIPVPPAPVALHNPVSTEEQSLAFGRAPKRVLVRNQSAPTKNLVRIRWGKDASLRYMSHLENIRLIERMIRRASLPVAHTNAVRPTMKLAHGHPLPLGFTSEAELIEITLDQNWQTSMIENLRAVQPNGLVLYDARIVYGRTESFASRINRAVYHLAVADIHEESRLIDSISALLAQNEMLVQRAGKSGATTVDIRPAVRAVVVEEQKLVMTLGLGESGYARPTEVLALLVPGRPEIVLPARFHRADLYCETTQGERIAGMDV